MLTNSNEQTELKIEFIEANIDLCNKVLFFYDASVAMKTEDGRLLIAKGRNEYGYSKKTANSDILRYLQRQFFRMKRISIRDHYYNHHMQQKK